MNELIFPCFCCLIIGALGGFAAGFRLAAMVLAPKPAPQPVDQKLAEDFA